MISKKNSYLLFREHDKGAYYYFMGIFLLAVWLLTACGGGSSTGPDNPDDGQDVVSVQGVVYGPSTDAKSASTDKNSTKDSIKKQDDFNLAAQKILSKEDIDGEAPVAEVKVDVFNITEYVDNPDGAEPLATTTTDGDGQYTVSDIPQGIDVLIMLDVDPRLSTVIVDIDDESSADINSITTLASEHWGPYLMDGSSFSLKDFQNTTKAAEELLEEEDGAALADILDTLIPAEFGEGFPDYLPPDMQIIVDVLEGIDLDACQDLELETSTGKPMAEVVVRGLKDDFGDEPWAWLYDADADNPGEDDRHLVYVERTTDEEALLVIPIHPGAYMEGGSAEMVFFDEDESFICPGLDFDVEPLDPAPGMFKAMVDSMEILFENEAESFGEDPDDLRTMKVSELEDDRPHLALIAAGLQMVDGPDYPNNLRARLAGEAPMFEERALNEEGLELFNALAAETGYANVGLNKASKPKNLNKSKAGITDCLVEPRNISTPAELNCWMDVQQTYGEFQEGQEARRDLALSITSLIGEVEIPLLDDDSDINAIQELASTIEAPLQWSQMMADGLDSMMPSELLGITLEVGRTDYNEDEDEESSWISEIAATGSSWEADVLLTIEVASFGGVGRGGKMLSKKAGHSKKIQDFVENTTDDIFSEMQDNDIGVIEIDPIVYGPVEIDPNRDGEDEYISWQFETKDSETGEEPFIFLSDESTYKPAAVGESELIIKTQDGVFQDTPALNNDFFSVKKINVSLHEDDSTGVSPDIFRIGPEDNFTLDLWAEVENADDKSVEWFLELEEGPHVASLSTSGTGKRSAVIDASSIQEQEDTRSVYRIEAESVTEEGLRDGLDPKRSDVARIIFSDEDYELQVSGTGCVPVGDSYQFRAQVDGEEIDFSELTWSVSGPGILETDGTFISNQSGNVTINFEYDLPDQDETLTDQITFEVSESCGTLTVSSDEFEYTSTCPSSLYFPDYGAPSDAAVSALVSNAHGNDEPFTISVEGMLTNITDSGSWTRELTVVNKSPDYTNGEFVLEVEDAEGNLWEPIGALESDSFYGEEYIMTINRSEEEIDGEVFGIFDGSFEMRLQTGDPFEENHETIMVEGEFSGIRYGDYGCGEIRHADYEE